MTMVSFSIREKDFEKTKTIMDTVYFDSSKKYTEYFGSAVVINVHSDELQYEKLVSLLTLMNIQVQWRLDKPVNWYDNELKEDDDADI